MLAWLRRRRERRLLVRETAARAVSSHGPVAWGVVYRRSRERGIPDDERQFVMAVRCEIERLLRIPARVDTATRWLSDNSVFTGSTETSNGDHRRSDSPGGGRPSGRNTSAGEPHADGPAVVPVELDAKGVPAEIARRHRPN